MDQAPSVFYRCNKCGRCYLERTKFLEHKMTHLTNPAVSLKPVKNESEDSKNLSPTQKQEAKTSQTNIIKIENQEDEVECHSSVGDDQNRQLGMDSEEITIKMEDTDYNRQLTDDEDDASKSVDISLNQMIVTEAPDEAVKEQQSRHVYVPIGDGVEIKCEPELAGCMTLMYGRPTTPTSDGGATKVGVQEKHKPRKQSSPQKLKDKATIQKQLSLSQKKPHSNPNPEEAQSDRRDEHYKYLLNSVKTKELKVVVPRIYVTSHVRNGKTRLKIGKNDPNLKGKGLTGTHQQSSTNTCCSKKEEQPPVPKNIPAAALRLQNSSNQNADEEFRGMPVLQLMVNIQKPGTNKGQASQYTNSLSNQTRNALEDTFDRDEDDADAICPICDKMDDGSPMVGCDECWKWFHFHCTGLTKKPVAREWFCRICKFGLLTDTGASTNQNIEEGRAMRNDVPSKMTSPKTTNARIEVPGSENTRPSRKISKRTRQSQCRRKPKPCTWCSGMCSGIDCVECTTCIAVYHLVCADLEEPVPADEAWYCERCKADKHSEDEAENTFSKNHRKLRDESAAINQCSKIKPTDGHNKRKQIMPKRTPATGPKKLRTTETDALQSNNLQTTSYTISNRTNGAVAGDFKVYIFYACPLCPKIFASRDHRGDHFRTIHEEAVQSIAYNDKNWTQEFTDNKAFECPVCSEIFNSPTEKIVHLAAHAEDNIKPCPFCDVVVPSQKRDDLLRHIAQEHLRTSPTDTTSSAPIPIDGQTPAK